ncbi:hypothetical protein OH76DRAFT_1412844 [Lentinus brumalis]|uniref:F-box domain-containing protein n=1 Tax=Lentinus brumalis TaxID=2498619 RepID=A0A371CK17_9APHY|nr:hypothetical protein OH76DRAFT_1412844 [Polyporus brumalis]
MWKTFEDDFMAAVEEAVKDEPPPPLGMDDEEDDGEEDAAVETNGIDIIMKGYEDELKSCTEYSGLTAQEICIRLQRPLCATPSLHNNPQQLGCEQIQGHPLSLPIDVFLQVASYLSPLELLRCTRTSRMLRRTLLFRKNRPLWRTVLHSIPQLPMCPNDMSEPSYAALVFDEHCFACGVEDAHCVDYALRVRLCEFCWNTKVGEGVDVLNATPEAVSCMVTMLTPCESATESWNQGTWWEIKDIEPTQHKKYHLYHLPELVSALGSLWPPPTIEQWDVLKPFLLEHVKILRRRQVHAILVQYWVAMICERKDAIFLQPDRQYEELRQSCVSLDLADTEGLMSPGARVIIQDLCPTLRRDHELLRARYQEIFDYRHEKRFELLEQWYEELLEGPWAHFDHRMYPNRHDGGRFASLSLRRPRQYDRRGHHTRGEFWNRGTLQALRGHIADYEIQYANILANLVTTKLRKERGEEAARALKAKNDLEETLSMPYALFICTECGEAPLAYPDIHIHWREQHPDIPVCKPADLLLKDKSENQDRSGSAASQEGTCESDDDSYSPTPSEIQEYYEERSRRPFELKSPYWVELWDGGWEAQKIILEATGIAEDIWVPELTRLLSCGRLYCACGNPSLPDPARLTWGDFVEHIDEELDWLYVRQGGRTVDVHDDRPTLLDDHEGFQCIKLLPDGADTSPAHYRLRADPETRTRIEAKLASGPSSAEVVCRICDDSVQPDDQCFLPPLYTADDIVYHFKAKHSNHFEEHEIILRVPAAITMRS